MVDGFDHGCRSGGIRGLQYEDADPSENLALPAGHRAVRVPPANKPLDCQHRYRAAQRRQDQVPIAIDDHAFGGAEAPGRGRQAAKTALGLRLASHDRDAAATPAAIDFQDGGETSGLQPKAQLVQCLDDRRFGSRDPDLERCRNEIASGVHRPTIGRRAKRALDNRADATFGGIGAAGLPVQQVEVRGRPIVSGDHQVRHRLLERMSKRPQGCQGVVTMRPFDGADLAQRMTAGTDRFDGTAGIRQRDRQAGGGYPANRRYEKDLDRHQFYPTCASRVEFSLEAAE